MIQNYLTHIDDTETDFVEKCLLTTGVILP